MGALVKCLAVKSKGGKLEDWEYQLQPLRPGEVGGYLTICCSMLRPLCKRTLTGSRLHG